MRRFWLGCALDKFLYCFFISKVLIGNQNLGYQWVLHCYSKLRYIASHKYFKSSGRKGLLVPYKFLICTKTNQYLGVLRGSGTSINLIQASFQIDKKTLLDVSFVWAATPTCCHGNSGCTLTTLDLWQIQREILGTLVALKHILFGWNIQKTHKPIMKWGTLLRKSYYNSGFWSDDTNLTTNIIKSSFRMPTQETRLFPVPGLGKPRIGWGASHLTRKRPSHLWPEESKPRMPKLGFPEWLTWLGFFLLSSMVNKIPLMMMGWISSHPSNLNIFVIQPLKNQSLNPACHKLTELRIWRQSCWRWLQRTQFNTS